MVLETAALCLAFTIYFEARSDTVKSRTAIAEVVMERANNDQKNICKVVYKKHAFGWVERTVITHKNKNNQPSYIVRYNTDSNYYLRKVNSHKGPKNKLAWEDSKKLAESVIRGKYKRALPRKANHFYNPKIDPRPKWATNNRYVATIESHKYYFIK